VAEVAPVDEAAALDAVETVEPEVVPEVVETVVAGEVVETEVVPEA
jgi:hypothetical protein